jgi:hypothetical protein
MWAGESFYCASCCDILIHSHPTKALRNPAPPPPSAVSTEMLRIEPAHKDRPVRGPRPTMLDRKRLEKATDSEMRCSHCGRLVSGVSPLTVDDQPLCPSCCEQALKDADSPEERSATVRAHMTPEDLLPQFPN